MKLFIRPLRRNKVIIFVLAFTPFPSKVLANSTESANLQEEIQKFSIARGYFSDILNSQLVIFSGIVGLLLIVNWLYQRRVTKDEIEKEVNKEVRAIRKKLNDELGRKQKSLVKIITGRLNQGDVEINLLRGEVYRSMAQFWDSQSSYSTAFIWWTRAAFNFSLVKDEDMTRICLGSAKRSVEKVVAGHELRPDIMGESQRLISLIDDKIYKVEKDLLYEALKMALSKKFSSR